MKYFASTLDSQVMNMSKEKFEVGESSIEGRGGFAVCDIQKGDIICTMGGDTKTFEDFEEMHRLGHTRISCDQLQIGVRTYIFLEEPYVFLNHSCNPNAGIKGQRTMTALRDIKKGEEITYDYSATEWTVQDYPPYYTDGWPMHCRCNSSECRTKVACFLYLPESVKRKYVESGIIQDHILERLREPKEMQRCLVCESILEKTL